MTIDQFINAVEGNVEEMLDNLTSLGYQDKYDITIGMNGTEIKLPLCADTYAFLIQFLKNIKELDE